ncbi:MAG: hypothetical protein RIQ71_1161 [Verrucomicrobiota bacterium]|jgi:hypothetical protein
MTALRIFVAGWFCAALGACTTDGKPMVQIEPVTADDPPAEVHMSAPAVAAEQGPMSF